MTCSITYNGTWAPVMRWFSSVTRHNFTDVTIDRQPAMTTSQLMLVASAGLDGSQVVCVTYFTEPASPLSTTATNIPSYTDTWTSATLIVECK